MSIRNSKTSGTKSQFPGTLSGASKELWTALAKRAIKEDQTATRSANEDGNMRVDVFSDGSGIDSGLSTGYTQRTSPNYDVIATPAGGGLIRPGDFSTGLQGYWKLNEASGSRTDSSTNGNNLTDNNTVGSSTQNYWNLSENSADFERSNSEWLDITDGAQTGLDMIGTWSSSAFIKLEADGAGQVRTILAKKNNDGDADGYRWGVYTDEKLFMYNSSSLVQSNGLALSAGKWYHVAVVYTGSFVIFYVDGNVDSITAFTTNPAANAITFTVGRRSGGSFDYFDGLMKDVAIWNTNLSSSQIKSLALGVDLTQYAFRPDDTSLPSPTSYWKLNELSSGAGTVTRNDSVGSNNLTDNATVTTGRGYIEGAGGKFTQANTEYLSITHASQSGLDLTAGDFTLSGWFYQTFTGAHTLMSKFNNAGNGWMIHAGGSLTLYIGGTPYSATGFTPSTNTWYHFAITYNSTTDTLKFYIDGKFVSQNTSVAQPTSNTVEFRIGYRGDNPGSTFAWDGSLSDIAIWGTTELSASQVSSLACGLPLQQQGVISYWKLNELNGTRADEIGSNDLTDNNTVGFAVGQVGNAADFERDNSEYLSISDASQSGLDFSDQMTLLAWAKPEQVPASGTFVIFGKNQSSGGDQRSYNLNHHVESGVQRFNVLVSSDGTSGGIATLNDLTTTINAGQFYHVVGRYDGTTLKLFIDSKETASTSYSLGIFNSTAPFVIGGNETGAGDPYDGLIDEAIVAARWFRPEEIKTVYNKGLNGKEATSSEISFGSGIATVISTAFTASEVPTHALLVANKTLSSGSITLYVSRVSSPGTNFADTTKWTQVTENVITDITKQDSGTSCRWGATINNPAELDDLAVIFGKANE